MNHPEDPYTHYSYDQHPFSVRLPQILSTVALLVLSYYVLSYLDAWPSTSKRALYELSIRLIPSRIIYLLQHVMMRFGRLSSQESPFGQENFGDFRAKEEALQRMLGKTHIPNVLNRARAFSGYNRLLPTHTEDYPPGLGNWDNSCYQNSILQGLASLPAFQQYIHRSLLLCEKTRVEADTIQALNEFLDQLSDVTCQKKVLWTPKVLKSMDSWQQQDAQEYFSRIQDAIEKEALQYGKVISRHSNLGLGCLRTELAVSDADKERTAQNVVRNLASNPMDGMLAQALTCQTCGFSEGVSLTQFNCLTVNMGMGGQRSLDHLFDEYTEPELIDGVECDNCTKLAHKTESVDENKPANESGEDSESSRKKENAKKVLRTKAKQITLGRLPKDLVVHVNRSIWDNYGEQIKNTACVRFPSTLDFLGQWCAPLEAKPESTQAVYELKCTVTHSGRHDNGHYVAYGKRGKDWYCFNDDIVTKMTEQEVLTRGNVFMLFYEAVDRSELMSSDTDCTHVKDVVAKTATPSTPSTESDAYEDPAPDPTTLPVPVMRTASGGISVTDRENSQATLYVPAV